MMRPMMMCLNSAGLWLRRLSDLLDPDLVIFSESKGNTAGVPPVSIRGGRSTSFRSALEPNIHYSRSLLIDRCAGGANDYVN